MDPTSLLTDFSYLGNVLLYVVGALGLHWVGGKIRGSNLGALFGFAACCAAAYAAGMAVEIGSLQVVGISAVNTWSLFFWMVLGVTGFVVASAAAPSGWVAMIPCCIIGALMMLQGPLTADPLTNFPLGARGFNQSSPLMHSVTFAGGMVMLFVSVLAGLAVGAGHAAEQQQAAAG